MAKIYFLFFLVTLFTSHNIYARESQFFNKIPSNTNNLAVENQPKQEDPLNKQEPNFIPENDNGGYGLYGHESGQLPPTTTTTTTTINPTNTNTNLPYNNEPTNYLPKNYNSESYVTVSEGYNPGFEKRSYPATTTINPTNKNTNLPYNNEPTNYLPKNYNSKSYVTVSEGYNPGFEKQSYPATTTAVTVKGGQYYNENSYNGKQQQQGVNEFKLGQTSYKSNVVGNNNYNYNYKSNGGNNNNNYPVEKQGMSDTRFMENGKYFYDINLEKNNGYPFQNTQGFDERQFSENGNGYDENFNSFTSNDDFENKQFQDFQDEKGFP